MRKPTFISYTLQITLIPLYKPSSSSFVKMILFITEMTMRFCLYHPLQSYLEFLLGQVLIIALPNRSFEHVHVKETGIFSKKFNILFT